MHPQETETRSPIEDLVESLPDADRPGQPSKFTGPPPEEAARVAQAILKEGTEAITAVARMVRDGFGGGERNYKPGYALRILALAVGAPGMERERRMFAEALLSLLGEGEGKPDREVQAFLIRELQLAADAAVVPALGRILADDFLCEYAAQALLAIREGAAREFRKAWPRVRGRNRVTVAQALGVLVDPEAVDLLLEAARDEDRDVRIAAVWSLGTIGDRRAARAVLDAYARSEGWEKIQAAKACLLLAEKRAAAGDKKAARRIYEALRKNAGQAGEENIVEAAERGLESLRA